MASHLLNVEDNDHVTMHELRGFMGDSLHDALDEVTGVAKGTYCKQPFFSLSFNPPKGARAGLEVFEDAIERAEKVLGLEDQPRAIVVHEKQGRRHIHVVWSRIDATEMKAINLPFFQNRLKELSKELYLENNWELPEGHKTNGWKNPYNFTLGEFQQASRQGLDPREIKQIFATAWQASDSLSSFRNALEDHGYFLARGDRRGFVALDTRGEIHSVARSLGLKTKEVGAKLGAPDSLPDVTQTRADIQAKINGKLLRHVNEHTLEQRKELEPLASELRSMREKHRRERRLLNRKLNERQELEGRHRADRFRRGLAAVFDFLSGKTARTRKANEAEAYQGYLRDRHQREGLFTAQMKDRQVLQVRIEALTARQRQARMSLTRQIVDAFKYTPAADAETSRQRGKDRGLDLTL